MSSVSLPPMAHFQSALTQVRARLPPTPLFAAPDLEALAGRALWLKAESLQPTGSFKVRGVINWLHCADEAQRRAGLVTVSAGNHALALAWGARQHPLPVTVVMPKDSSPLKIERTKALGAQVVLKESIQEAVSHCAELREQHRLTLVHPYNDPDIMAGQGTVALEMLAQLPHLRQVLCPVGGGGLAGGMGLVLKALRPDVELIGIEPEGAATLRNAWDQGRDDAALPGVNTMAASLAPVVVGNYTYAATRATMDHLVTVTEEGIREATSALLTRGHLYAETGAAVTLAALMEGRIPASDGPTVAVVTGGNMDLQQVATLSE
ncbi:MAG: threonine/serine dehydratase [Oleiphilaceae bacterium]|nr:threonine/serine dehydratase [Oleiphilaceae bacterium]